jgi:amino acid adenylation domain-containing protein
MDELILAASRKPKEQAFWLEQFSGGPQPAVIPYDMPEAGEATEYNEHSFQLTGEAAAGIRKMAGGSNVRLHLLLTSLTAVLAGQYGNTEDIVIGTPIFSGGNDADLINTLLPLRVRTEVGMSFKELVLRVRDLTVRASEYQNFPMEILCDKLGLPWTNGRFPLFDIAVVLADTQARRNVLPASPSIVFEFSNDNEALTGTLLYKTALYHPQTIERLALHFQNLAGQMTADPATTMEAVDILTPQERSSIMDIFNGTSAPKPPHQTIVQWFERQVTESADKVAVRFHHEHLTYTELNRRANRLAHYLRSRGVKRDIAVGLLMDRSLELIVAVVAVLKAGGAYLPLDPHVPEQRIHTILEENKVSLLITEDEVVRALSFSSLQAPQSLEATIIKSPARPPVPCFDDLAKPNRSLVDYTKYHRSIGIAPVKQTVTLQISRGCPYNCLYCHKIWPKTHHARSAENVMEEIRYCYEAGARNFVFIDDIFNLDKKNSGKILETIIKEKLDVQLFFPNGLRADILDREFIDLMAAAGTVNIDVALESASPRIQKLMRKNLNIDKFVENVRYIAEHHPQIILEMEMMQGFPTETQEEAMLTLEVLKEIKWIHFPNLNILKIFPNTDMYRLAIENGVSKDEIMRSTNFAYHELPTTLPYPATFTKQCQAILLDEYFLSKERLKAVLPVQMKILSQEELIQKYDTYLPTNIRSFDDILEVCDLTLEDLGEARPAPENGRGSREFDQNIKRYFNGQKSEENALRVLLLDLSQFFSADSGEMLYDVVEEPLGLMYLMTHLQRSFGPKIHGKILKSRIDFDSYGGLRQQLEDFKPDVIGIRTLSYFKDFFHRAVTRMRQWGIDVPIIAGGPYATSDYMLMLKDANVDLAVLGEGELTFAQLVENMLANGNRLPDRSVLASIQGLAFVDDSDAPSPEHSSREIVLLDPADDWLPADTSNPEAINQPEDLLYLISTSGSTGKPKSVMMEHHSLCDLIHFQYQHTGIDFSRVLQFASISFDVSFQEIFSTLLAGGELHMVDEDLRGQVGMLWEMLEKNAVSTMFIPPAFLRFVFEEEHLAATFPRSIAHVVTAGEQLMITEPMNRTFRGNGVTVHNHYGPSETHVVTTYTATAKDELPQLPPIGKPISNVKIYITDHYRRLQPVGIPGELYIAGTMVGRGYYRKEDLTAERYFNGLFSEGERVFRTGDLARWLEDGSIQYLGRNDQQVQIRGFRVELTEIERYLAAVTWVKKAALVDLMEESGEVSLAAYIVSEGEDLFDADLLRDRLAAELPDYMVPMYYIRVKEIPLNNSGKVDRRKLPRPGSDEARSGFTPPRDERERGLAEIWASVLGVPAEKMGIDDNFFHLGGHSLKGTILISRVHKEMGVKLQLVDLFKSPTIRKMARLLQEAGPQAYDPIPKAPAMDHYPLSPAQKRLYIQQQMNPQSTTYNIPAIVLLEGETGKDKIQTTFQALADRHEALRTSFVTEDGTPVQQIRDSVAIDLVYRVEEGIEAGDIEAIDRLSGAFIKPFDLAAVPLTRVELVKLARGKHLLMVDMHHIISDAVSVEILIREFRKLHSGLSLPALDIQYRDFTMWQLEQLESDRYRRQEEFWLRQLDGEIPVLDLPLDFERPPVKSGKGDSVHQQLEPAVISAVEELCRRKDCTKYQLLLTVYFVLLNRYSGQRDIIVGSPISGRRHPQVESLLGVFVNMVALRCNITGDTLFEDVLRQVKETAIAAFDSQDVPFERLVDALELRGEAGRNPLFDVGFLLNAIDMEDRAAEPLDMTAVGSANKVSRFDMLLAVMESSGRLAVSLEFSTDLLRIESAQKILLHYTEILQQVLDNPAIPIDGISISSRLDSAAGLEDEDDIQFGF